MIKIVDGKYYLEEVKNLLIEYSERLGRDLSFQNIDDELANPAHKYTAPEGEILVVLENDKVLGMVTYHRHSDERCEMKRLYVKPETRGMHLGEMIVQEIIKHARKAGYTVTKSAGNDHRIYHQILTKLY